MTQTTVAAPANTITITMPATVACTAPECRHQNLSSASAWVHTTQGIRSDKGVKSGDPLRITTSMLLEYVICSGHRQALLRQKVWSEPFDFAFERQATFEAGWNKADAEVAARKAASEAYVARFRKELRTEVKQVARQLQQFEAPKATNAGVVAKAKQQQLLDEMARKARLADATGAVASVDSSLAERINNLLESKLDDVPVLDSKAEANRQKQLAENAARETRMASKQTPPPKKEENKGGKKNQGQRSKFARVN